MTQTFDSPVISSFRDPSGFLFYRKDVLHRQVNISYKDEYVNLKESGLYQSLVDQRLLVAHEETIELGMTDKSLVVIKPESIPFISYPYEWSFSQLKDAALLTLDIQIEALSKGMCLKDASAYNVQFKAGQPIFIDTLSFETYSEGKPWTAYKQFCQHFLAPLALMSHTDVRLNKLLVTFIDGIPLDLATTLLPKITKLNLSLSLHIHLHAKKQAKSSDLVLDNAKLNSSISKRSLLALIDSLKSAIKNLKWEPKNTEWRDYYINNNNYEGESLSNKEKIVSQFVASIKPDLAWDLGANDGRFSRIVSQHALHVVSWDIDPACVENNYRTIKKNNELQLLPLIIDLSNPSPSIGWSNIERPAFMERGPCDLVLSLGLVHHLAISNNLPLERIAQSFSQLSTNLLIEFIPKEDSQVIKLLSSRPDIFPNYTQEGFEKAFSNYYSIEKVQAINGTVRTLYLLKTK